MHPNQLTSQIKFLAKEAGFDLAQITRASSHPEGLDSLLEWIKQGGNAGMSYMAKNPNGRANPQFGLESARSMILLGKAYSPRKSKNSSAQIAAYALRPDYHTELKNRMNQLIKNIQKLTSDSNFHPFVDSFPLLERAFGNRAGLGFFGKNTMLINKTLGSNFFICGILTDLSLEPDTPVYMGNCGTCTLCLEACPTGALEKPFYLNAAKCISYLTIEHKGSIAEELRSKVGNWLFGCDICQDVCPHNRSKFNKTPPPPNEPLRMESILNLSSNREFENRLKGTALLRPRRKGLLRNACLVAGNSGDKKWIPFLVNLLGGDRAPLVRESAAWALGVLGGFEAKEALEEEMAKEKDPEVQRSIKQAIRRSSSPTVGQS